MADDKLNQDKAQTSEEIEKTPGEMGEADLEQVSGGMQQSISLAGAKMNTSLVNGNSVKKNQGNEISYNKTIKL